MSELIVVPGEKKMKRKNSATRQPRFFSAQNYDGLIFCQTIYYSYTGGPNKNNLFFFLLGWCYSYEKNLLTLYLCAIEN